MVAKQTPIVIIGGGPVGLVLAIQLNALGVRSVLVNKDTGTRRVPKGSTHNSRTMEHYRRLGIANKIRLLGLPSDDNTDVSFYTRLNGWELARLEMPSSREKMRRVQDAAPTDQVPEPIHRANQMYVEAFLFDYIKTCSNVTLRYGWQCIGFEDVGDGVEVKIEEIASGKHDTLRCGFLVGCDGGESFVRRSLGIRYGGEKNLEQPFFGGRMVSAHLRAPDLYRCINRRSFHYWILNPLVRFALITLDGAGDFLFWAQLGSDELAVDDKILGAFQYGVGRNIGVEIIDRSFWTAGQALVAERFCHGRIFLAGDAVHLFTPTGGFGMNTGIDDIVNLAWKLAATVKGWGGPNLLASYERERKPIAIRNTLASRALARNVGEVPVEPEIEEDSAQGAAARQRAAAVLGTFGEEFASLGVQLGARYDGSDILIGDGITPPPDVPEFYVPSACPGGRAPHLWLPDRSSLFDHFGSGFTLLRFRRDCCTDTLESAARVRGMPLKIVDVQVPQGRDLYERDLALIRPDQHVAWRGNRLPDDCASLVATVTGW
jgi:2-polyprenyl-6-methoxyphenol hydroxylase-like FAD-dependent oxidoreductase